MSLCCLNEINSTKEIMDLEERNNDFLEIFIRQTRSSIFICCETKNNLDQGQIMSEVLHRLFCVLDKPIHGLEEGHQIKERNFV